MVGYHGAWIRVDNKLRFLPENSNERPVGVVGHRIGATAAGIEVLRMRMDPKVLDTMPEEALTKWGIERAADTA